MAEERNVPDLDTLLSDISEMQQRFDVSVAANEADPVRFMQNDVLPWLKDFVESTLIACEDLLDRVDPIKISGADAANIAEILQSAKVANAANTALVERIDEALDAIDQGDDEEDEEEGGEGEAN